MVQAVVAGVAGVAALEAAAPWWWTTGMVPAGLWGLVLGELHGVVAGTLAGHGVGHGGGYADLLEPWRCGSCGLVPMGGVGWWRRHTFSLARTFVVLDLGLALERPDLGLRRVGALAPGRDSWARSRWCPRAAISLHAGTVRGGGGRDIATLSGGSTTMATDVA